MDLSPQCVAKGLAPTKEFSLPVRLFDDKRSVHRRCPLNYKKKMANHHYAVRGFYVVVLVF